MAPPGQEPAEGLTVVRLADMPPSRLVVAWRASDTNPLLHSYVEFAAPAGERGNPEDGV